MKNVSVVVATYIAVYSRLDLVFGVKCFSQVHCKKWLKKRSLRYTGRGDEVLRRAGIRLQGTIRKSEQGGH